MKMGARNPMDREDFMDPKKRHEEIMKRHTDRIKNFHTEQQGSRNPFKSTDRHKSAIRERTDRLIDRIEKSTATEEVKTTLKTEAEDYYRLEIKLLETRFDMTQHLEKARELTDPEERMKFLEEKRRVRDAAREEERKERDAMIQVRTDLFQKVDALYGRGELRS